MLQVRLKDLELLKLRVGSCAYYRMPTEIFPPKQPLSSTAKRAREYARAYKALYSLTIGFLVAL